MPTDVEISTIFIGGGTPSSVDIKYIDGLFRHLRAKFDLSKVFEITVECNPESVTEKLLQCLKNNGVNRLSFGLQSANNDTLKTIGRLHTYEQFLNALSIAQKLGFENINVDIILGLPEKKSDFQNSINTVAKLPLQHVSVYALELQENSAIYHICKEHFCYSEDDLADMYDYAVDALQSHGFDRYEISNFAKEGCECKHNLGYWQEKRYYGFGASASGFVGNVRYDNVYSLRDYIATPTKDLVINKQDISIDEQANEYVMLGLRLAKGISLSAFCKTYGKDFFGYFGNAKKLISQGFLQVVGDSLFVPKEKFYVVNSILCELLNLD